LVGLHLPSDLAVLRVEGELSPLPWAAPESLALAELVLAFARPSEQLRARLGIVSVLGEKWRLPGGTEFERYIESDLGPASGFSGGPLVRATGELIGLNNGRLSRGALLTLPAAGVSRIVAALLAHGRVPRAHLGVAVQAVALPKGLVETLGRASGLLVLSVQTGSAAERAGLMLGDLLLDLAQKPLARVGDLESALGDATLGAELALELIRGGERRQLSVRAEER
jgi:S1-C subfamily serine protease